jgi:hypothetical protein
MEKCGKQFCCNRCCVSRQMKVDHVEPNVKLSQRDPVGIDLGSNFYQIMAKRNKDANSLMRDIKRKTRRRFSSEEKIRIVLDGLRGEESIAALCLKASSYFFLLLFIVKC